MTGTRVLMIFLSAFAVIIAVNFGMAWMAITTFSGEVGHAPPPAGLKMVQNPAAPHDDFSISVAQQGELLKFNPPPSVEIASIEATLSRPVTDKENRVLKVASEDDAYAAPIADIGRGQWLLALTVHTTDGQVLMHHERLVLK